MDVPSWAWLTALKLLRQDLEEKPETPPLRGRVRAGGGGRGSGGAGLPAPAGSGGMTKTEVEALIAAAASILRGEITKALAQAEEFAEKLVAKVKGLPEGTADGELLEWNGTEWVVTPAPKAGEEVLEWSGGAWATTPVKSAWQKLTLSAKAKGIASDGPEARFEQLETVIRLTGQLEAKEEIPAGTTIATLPGALPPSQTRWVPGILATTSAGTSGVAVFVRVSSAGVVTLPSVAMKAKEVLSLDGGTMRV